MFSGLVWLLSLNFRGKWRALTSNRPAIFLITYFIWCLVGLLYTSNIDAGLQDVGQKVPFFAWALIIGAMPTTLNYKPLILKGFILSCIAVLTYYFIEATYAYQQSKDVLEFHFNKLVESDIVPPHYFAMMLNFAYAILLHAILRKKVYLGAFADVFAAIFFAIGIIFLSVRMQYVVFIVVNLVVVWGYSKEKKGKKFAWLAMLATFMLFSAAIYSYPGSRRRITDAINEAISFNKVVNYKQTNHRKFLWQYGGNVVVQNPILGTGTGASDDALNKELERSEDKFWNGTGEYLLRDKKYNYHNAYLQQLATHGTVGLFILLVMLFAPLLGMYIKVEARLFLIVCALSFLTESMFQRQAGILFFSFFYPLLLNNTPSLKEGDL